MSHLRHRTIYKNPPRGLIFIDSSIVTEICYIVYHSLANRIRIKKMSTNFKPHKF